MFYPVSPKEVLIKQAIKEMHILEDQYEFVKESRNVFLGYYKSISNDNFTRSEKTFGRGGSVRNLLTHIANTYNFWIGECIQQKNMNYSEYDSVKNITDVIHLFDNTNTIMDEFFIKYSDIKDIKVRYEINNIPGESYPFRIFTHVLTHEFHHKGQIMSLSRKWGYIPVDTDIMR